MSDIQSLIKMLQSDNHNKRYDACEELRVLPSLPPEATEALRLATNDPNPDVADAAQRAIALHTPKLPPEEVNGKDKEQNLKQDMTITKVNQNTVLGIGLLVGFLITAIYFILFIGFNLLGSTFIFILTGAIGSIFGMIGSVIGYKLTKSINGVWIGAIIGTVVGFGGCLVFLPTGLL